MGIGGQFILFLFIAGATVYVHERGARPTLSKCFISDSENVVHLVGSAFCTWRSLREGPRNSAADRAFLRSREHVRRISVRFGGGLALMMSIFSPRPPSRHLVELHCSRPHILSHE